MAPQQGRKVFLARVENRADKNIRLRLGDFLDKSRVPVISNAIFQIRLDLAGIRPNQSVPALTRGVGRLRRRDATDDSAKGSAQKGVEAMIKRFCLGGDAWFHGCVGLRKVGKATVLRGFFAQLGAVLTECKRKRWPI
jgi:hypothetical protein